MERLQRVKIAAGHDWLGKQGGIQADAQRDP
jgi:hypothetical protein